TTAATPAIYPLSLHDALPIYHYPKAYTIAMAGAGVKGGIVLGKTDKECHEVVDRPVTIPDLFCTFHHALGIDPHKQNQAGTRPRSEEHTSELQSLRHLVCRLL